MTTEELTKKLLPVNARLKEIEKDRAERMKVRKRTKVVKKDTEGDVEMGDSGAAGASSSEPKPKAEIPGDLPDEKEARAKEAEELKALVHPDVAKDVGANVTGMYDLVGRSK